MQALAAAPDAAARLSPVAVIGRAKAPQAVAFPLAEPVTASGGSLPFQVQAAG